jgi:hypothetical protein
MIIWVVTDGYKRLRGRVSWSWGLKPLSTCESIWAPQHTRPSRTSPSLSESQIFLFCCFPRRRLTNTIYCQLTPLATLVPLPATPAKLDKGTPSKTRCFLAIWHFLQNSITRQWFPTFLRLYHWTEHQKDAGSIVCAVFSNRFFSDWGPL